MAAFGWLGWLRPPLRRQAFALLKQAVETEDGRRIVSDVTRGFRSATLVPTGRLDERAYPDLGVARPASPRPTPVFITGRFRSGSTLLWTIFRHVPGCTSFYEPLNERRWFDPRTRGSHVDRTHLGVEEYWREYEGLEHLGQWYREEWIDRDLYMGPDASDPGLERYIDALIAAAPGRAVLQFNRVDFRLPWLRCRFPDARIIHLYRHPREQWRSTLAGVALPRDLSVADFAKWDSFYLLRWARDLSYHFPFLDPAAVEHPYDLFYLIWRLSYLFGREYAHISCCFEALCQDPGSELPRLMRVAGIERFDRAILEALIQAPAGGAWRQYADHEWFTDRESHCETILRKYVASDSVARAAYEERFG